MVVAGASTSVRHSNLPVPSLAKNTTFIPVVVIPVALIGAFFVMYLAGFTLNVLTLLGIVLAIGLVVDDAIIVLEHFLKSTVANIPTRRRPLGFGTSRVRVRVSRPLISEGAPPSAASPKPANS